MNFTLSAFTAAAAAIGRGVAFIADYWDGSTDLALTHLGETDGPIRLTPNESISTLTAEVTGPAPLRAYVDGAAPTIEIPFLLGTPALRATLSPTGDASIGHNRRRPVTYKTLAIFPEELLYDVDTKSYKVLAYTGGGGWTVNGEALTAEQTRLMGHAIWAWKGYFSRPPVTMSRGDADKAVESATFSVVLDTTKPDGHQLITIGDPEDAGIDIEPVAS